MVHAFLAFCLPLLFSFSRMYDMIRCRWFFFSRSQSKGGEETRVLELPNRRARGIQFFYLQKVGGS